MTGRRWALLALALLLIGAAVLWRNVKPRAASPDSTVRAATASTAFSENRERATASTPPLSSAARERLLRDSVEAHLADNLNLPEGTIQSDVGIVGSMLAAYRSIHRGQGNPIGDNRDIVRALQGANPNGVIFLARRHRAINAQGELCDRWGTPFFFHAESGTRMEIRSAGPDRRLFTADDVAITP